MREVQRFYRATVTSRTGAWLTISFRADNLQLAGDHARHCCACFGYKFVEVRFIGRQEPTDNDFGRFQPA